MIATAPHTLIGAPRLGFEHLLLGDLRELLDEHPGRERDRCCWQLSTCCLFSGRERHKSICL